MTSARDMLLAVRAKRAGARWSLRIILEARSAGLPVSLAFALVEQESDFRNVFGHDPVSSAPKGAPVTHAAYERYKALRPSRGMQGVGLTQLTWWELQDQADQLGGCWIPKYQLRVAFRHLAALIRDHGVADGLRAYNGTGATAIHYSRQVREKAARWHITLTRKAT